MHEGRYAIIQAHAYQHMVRLITYGLSQLIMYLKHQSNDENHRHTWHNVCMILDEKFMAKNRGVLSASRSSHSHLFSIADVRQCGDAGRCEERKLTASYPQCPDTQFLLSKVTWPRNNTFLHPLLCPRRWKLKENLPYSK